MRYTQHPIPHPSFVMCSSEHTLSSFSTPYHRTSTPYHRTVSGLETVSDQAEYIHGACKGAPQPTLPVTQPGCELLQILDQADEIRVAYKEHPQHLHHLVQLIKDLYHDFCKLTGINTFKVWCLRVCDCGCVE